MLKITEAENKKINLIKIRIFQAPETMFLAFLFLGIMVFLLLFLLISMVFATLSQDDRKERVKKTKAKCEGDEKVKFYFSIDLENGVNKKETIQDFTYWTKVFTKFGNFIKISLFWINEKVWDLLYYTRNAFYCKSDLIYIE